MEIVQQHIGDDSSNSTHFSPIWQNFLRDKYLNSYKNTNHQQMHKESFIINRNTLLHVSTLGRNM
jgi:hypothetical protein